jgi:hypothetical protein
MSIWLHMTSMQVCFGLRVKGTMAGRCKKELVIGRDGFRSAPTCINGWFYLSISCLSV